MIKANPDVCVYDESFWPNTYL